ncbi:succinylglutamate desuccinylase/aspartoacylase family protein [Sandarakinorhabdus sp.]|uniref:succinylglutamate desuccinylase/aspartoacylase family protein n=1 Tax=Sandarakinorhabdus sp. TaxID=1916663 RepID=UPI00286E5360|nr:succinylglutamate desuccinylase/aspartoacylase family protein [Sandarakinorhabdus sp.]
MKAVMAAAALLAASAGMAATEASGSLDGTAIIDRLEVGDQPAGAVQRYWFRAGTSVLGQPWLVPVVVIRGARPGPRLMITAGIHGDELNGIAVIHKLAQGIDPARLAGTVTLVPGLNTPGLLQSSREWAADFSRASPNLNRVMPGKEGGRDVDDYAGRLWARLIRPNADLAVDLHTQSRGTAYVMYAFASTARTRRMAELMAPDVIKMDKGEKGTVENTLTDDGVPAITLELGRPEMFDDSMIARGEAGIRNLMREQKMLEGAVTPLPPGSFVANSSESVRAPRAGWARLLVPLGSAVTKGQAVAVMTDAFGRVTDAITAPLAGRISSSFTDPRREQGGMIVRIVWWNPDPACAGGC